MPSGAIEGPIVQCPGSTLPSRQSGRQHADPGHPAPLRAADEARHTRKTPGNCSSQRPRSKIPAPARPRAVDTRQEGEARMPGPGGDTLASVAETLAGVSAAARAGSLNDTAALAALSAARSAAAELERSELAHRGGPGQRRDLDPHRSRDGRSQPADRPEASRGPRPPPLASTGGGHSSATDPGCQPRPRHPGGKSAGERGCSSEEHDPAAARPCERERPRPAVPKITDAIIAEGHYQLVRAPDHESPEVWSVCICCWRTR